MQYWLTFGPSDHVWGNSKLCSVALAQECKCQVAKILLLRGHGYSPHSNRNSRAAKIVSNDILFHVENSPIFVQELLCHTSVNWVSLFTSVIWLCMGWCKGVRGRANPLCPFYLIWVFPSKSEKKLEMLLQMQQDACREKLIAYWQRSLFQYSWSLSLVVQMQSYFTVPVTVWLVANSVH